MTSLVDTASSEFEDQVHKALRCWHDHRSQAGLLDHLLITHLAAAAHPATPRESTNRVLKRGLARLAADNPLDAKLLRLRFYRCLGVSEAKQHLHYAESTLYHKQSEAIDHLAAVLHRLEAKVWQERAARLEDRLEMPHGPLVGVEAQVVRLANWLSAAEGPWLISLAGPGGIGKTALAAAVLRRLAQTTTVYDGFGCVSAQVGAQVGAQVRALDQCGKLHRRAQFPTTSAALITALARQLLPHAARDAAEQPDAAVAALLRYLRAYPHVVVLDNLDAVADSSILLRTLHALANPSKFVLISRRLLPEPHVHLHRVPELNAAGSLQLLRQTAQAHGLTPLLACDDEELLPVYAAAGGNPLALQWVVGQTYTRPLHTVLRDLSHTRTAAAAMLFDHVFGGALAELDQGERRVLQAMLAEERCLEADEICAVCRLRLAEVAPALQHLFELSLIGAEGDLEHCRHPLSNLARTCLQQGFSDAANAGQVSDLTGVVSSWQSAVSGH